MTGLIIQESHQDSDEDEDAQFVVEETVCPGTNLLAKLGDGDIDDHQEHGGLVTKMLQSKREFEAGNITSQSKIDSQVVLADHLDEASRQRERANIEKEVERLCQALQSLSRSALPLGKLMDFVQEDLESMQQEYERWTAENQALRAQIRQEESLTQTSLDPLRAQLNELKSYACEQRKAIATFKAKILTNDERIQDLLSKSLIRAR
ncbi:TRAF3-interacting protein 1 [Paragonimus westermani]|uniref:TRAF3-interacting protein 1 n=1 Tax=Paragonimus westermani TaxID=34504 RepID=A0A5J4NX84_9TREM|nr:TRAF3-interacting protein 1 [Paragonimus westermani]